MTTDNSTDYYSYNNTIDKYYVKFYETKYAADTARIYYDDGSGGSNILTPPRSTKDELMRLLRNDYEVAFAISSMIRSELVSALQNDYRVREILDRATTTSYWQREFIDGVMLAIEESRHRATNDEELRTRFNNMFIPVHKAKEDSTDRAVKLV